MLKNMDNIERIEVLRGAAGAMYGSGAKGGVINIITRNPSKTQTTIDMSEGAFHKENYQINTQGKADKLTYNAYYGKNIQGNVKDAKGTIWPGHSNSNNKGIKLTYDFNEKSQLMFNYNNSKMDYSGYDMYYKQDVRDSSYDTRDMTVQHRYIFSDKWQNTMTYRRNNTHSLIHNYYEQYNSLSTVDTHFKYQFFSDQVTYQSGRHTVVMGVDYSKANDLKARTKFDDSPTWMSNTSPYIQESWKILPKVTLSGGLRYDKPKRSDDVLFDSHTSKNYKLSYAATAKDTIYMGRSDFYILPGMFELTDPDYGNPKLLPAYGRTSSIGYTRAFSDRNLFTLNWFYTKGERTIGFDDDGKYKNYTNDVSRGWNAQWNPTLDSHWQMNLGWAHLYQKADGDNFSKGYQPKDLATLGIYYNQGRWDAGLDGFYFMRRVVPAKKKGWPSDKYGVFNASVSYAMSSHVNMYVKVSNIFNKYWAEQTQALWGQPGQYYAQPERTFLIGTQIKF
jgi:vitamin B12 transporter